jgi:hypothetical protein
MPNETFSSSVLRVAASLAAPGQPRTTFQALESALRLAPGHKLFTVLLADTQRHISRRIYSSAPQAYPCGGTKPIRQASEFYEKVLLAGQPRICRDAAACRAAFPDFDRIQALGCESAINFPVRFNGASLGSLNLLHESGWYAEHSLAGMELLSAFAVPVLLDGLSQLSETP